ncbi:hypothetical protein HZS_5100, partial [Henneguya salminicola]
MSERKAVNKYYPPEWRPEMGSINKFRKSHPLRERAKDAKDGVFTIRFEMPYNIWCNGCNNHIGMGVRYNAQKVSIGNYFTTRMFKFRMKCYLCNNHFEIRTDPQNNDYVILSGARRKEERWDAAESGAVQLMDHRDKNKLETNAMFRLEHTSMDKAKAANLEPTLKNLENAQSVWKDDYNINSSLRNIFRKEKQELKEIEVFFCIKSHRYSIVIKSLSNDLKLLPQNNDDEKIAKSIKFGKKEPKSSATKMIKTVKKSSIFPASKTAAS